MAIEQMYKLTEVAEILNISRRSIYNYIKDGKLKAVKLGNSNEWRVSESSVHAFIHAGESNDKA